MVFEYKMKEVKLPLRWHKLGRYMDQEKMLQAVHDEAEDGWELVSAVSLDYGMYGSTTSILLVFKRLKK